jgi:hypothetical protein
MYRGSCLCGNVQYEVSTGFAEIECCHCLICRKAHASAFAMGVTISRDAFSLIDGVDSSAETVAHIFMHTDLKIFPTYA